MPNIEGITVQKSNAERKSYVVVGAILSCSSGSQLSRLKMPFSHGVFVKGKPQMNIMDFVPNINIMPFGKCSSLKNPAVASATAANNGVLTPMPCTPVMTMPWIDGKPDKMVGEHPALLNKSTNMCFHCGQIKIEDDGQDLGGVTVGNQSPANSGSPNANFEQGPACEKPQEKPSMWDHFVKGISKLGDVPAAMQKAASELPGALEKAAEDLPKGIGVFVREGYIEPMQEDLDTLRDGKINFADGIALGGLALNALTLGRSNNIKNVVDVTRKGKKSSSEWRLNTYGDALRKSLGPAADTHADEYNNILRHAKESGVQVDFRKNALAYEPTYGSPGRLILDPDASIGAVRHEYRHMLDDFDLGHPGLRVIADSDLFWRLEYRGYMEEIKVAREIRDYDAGRFILKEMRARRKEILGR
ncbi:uncharacterized protein DUF4280 [Brevibacillus sp. AG162]|nr:uncharacterized protein DUF4280 [Brevibacillus sp. AG162]